MEIVVAQTPASAVSEDIDTVARSLDIVARVHGLAGGMPKVDGGTQGVVVLDDGSPEMLTWTRELSQSVRYLNLPIVAITDRALDMLEAGAVAAFGADESAEKILLLLKVQRDVQPVMSEIRDRLISPFITATEQAFLEMAGIEIKVRALYQKSGYRMFGDLSAIIGLLGESEGSMVLSFPDQMGRTLARRLVQAFGGEPNEDLLRDCVGELANVIAGQARCLITSEKFSFALSTPTVIAGSGHEIRHKPGNPCLVVAFESELGEFALQICTAVRVEQQNKGA